MLTPDMLTVKVGLSDAELERMCRAEGVGKVSRRDLPVYLATKRAGATTMASTMMIAAMAKIRVFATGGIGGVHRGAQTTMDISADLQELAQTPVAVVCAGAKPILDIGLTFEYLETVGVPVLGMHTDRFLAFFCRDSGYPVDFALESEKQAAAILRAQWDIGMKSGALIANRIPEQYAMDSARMAEVIDMALAECKAKNIHGKATTPFLLAKVVELTGGESLDANLQLAYNNARCTARIACALRAR